MDLDVYVSHRHHDRGSGETYCFCAISVWHLERIHPVAEPAPGPRGLLLLLLPPFHSLLLLLPFCLQWSSWGRGLEPPCPHVGSALAYSNAESKSVSFISSVALAVPPCLVGSIINQRGRSGIITIQAQVPTFPSRQDGTRTEHLHLAKAMQRWLVSANVAQQSLRAGAEDPVDSSGRE